MFSTERKADEQAQPLLCTTIFSTPFHGVIKGYSEPLKTPSILIEKEIEHLPQVFAGVILIASRPERRALADKDGFIQITK